MRVSRPLRYQQPPPIADTIVNGITVVSSSKPATASTFGSNPGNSIFDISVIMLRGI